MIISASRRTDIPAFYSEWFYNRIKEGYLLVRNPINIHQVSRVSLDPSLVDCIVFWTKNPKPMLDRISELNNYSFYFQYTLNAYDISIEPEVPKKKTIIETFKELSDMIGRERVIWRYDPIILTERFNLDYHIKWFGYIAEELHNYTNKCVFSFVDSYKKTERNMKDMNTISISKNEMEDIANSLSRIASKYDLKLETCSEEIDLDSLGIKHGKCIDDMLISSIIGNKISIDKDPNQREVCGCVKSIDIGAYNTCKHGCLYCYANYSQKIVKRNIMRYDKESPLLCDVIGEKDEIKEREMKSYIDPQLSFL